MGMNYACWKADYAAQKYAEGLEKKRQRNMPWFKDEFLPSVASRIGSNPKYPDSCILSEKQSNVVWFYMDPTGPNTAEMVLGEYVYKFEYRGNWPVLVRRTK